MMAGRNAVFWVLITDGVTARICSTGDASTLPILAPVFSPVISDEAESGWEQRAHRAWFRAQSQRIFSTATQQVALHLAQLLHEATHAGVLSGLIIIAAPEIRDELQRALSVETRCLLIGEIISDLPSFGEIDAEPSLELRH